MALDPSLPLQKAVRDALVEDPAIAALVEGNVFDQVPRKTTKDPGPFPRITIGQDDILDDGNTCGDGWRATVTVHVWTRRPPGYPPARRIASAVRAALLTLAIPGFVVVSAEHEATLFSRDPDGLTSHATVSVVLLIDPA